MRLPVGCMHVYGFTRKRPYPSLISLMVSVDVKHYVTLLKKLLLLFSPFFSFSFLGDGGRGMWVLAKHVFFHNNSSSV